MAYHIITTLFQTDYFKKLFCGHMQRTAFLKINEYTFLVYARHEHAYVEKYPTSETVRRIFHSIKRIAISYERRKVWNVTIFFWFKRKIIYATSA